MKVRERYEQRIDLTYPIWKFIHEVDEMWEKANNGVKREPDD
jgi:hypothetical protein